MACSLGVFYTVTKTQNKRSMNVVFVFGWRIKITQECFIRNKAPLRYFRLKDTLTPKKKYIETLATTPTAN